MSDDPLTPWRSIAAALTEDSDAGLVALTNRGLVRRARKDFVAEPPVLEEVDSEGLCFRVGGESVTLSEVPANSTCSCPSSVACRHILSAWLWLADSPPESGPGSTAVPDRDESPEWTEAELKKFFGKALLDRALRELASGVQVEFPDGSWRLARIERHGQECRWVPGTAGLAGMLCSCHRVGPCLHKALAIVGWEMSIGRRSFDEAAALQLEEARGAPRNRGAITAAVGEWLGDLVHHGLARVSPATETRLSSLTASAHGVELPRLEGTLRRLAGDLRAWMARDVQVSAASLLARASEVETVRQALIRTLPAAVGEHRQRYDPVGGITVWGVGARVWETRSGQRGATVYFWNPDRRSWSTWSNSRRDWVDFDPRFLLREPGPWEGCSSPLVAATSRLSLTHAWQSGGGRLSGRPETRALVLGPTPVGDLPSISSVKELRAQARRSLVGDASHEVDRLVLFEPARWGTPRFDPIRQQLEIPLQDGDGERIAMTLQHDAAHGSVVDWLEAANFAEFLYLFGWIRLQGGRLVVVPISLIGHDRFVHLTLIDPEDPASSSASEVRDGPAATTSFAGDPEPGELPGEEDSTDRFAIENSVTTLLEEVRSELEQLVEGGTPGYDPARLKRLRERVSRIGLARLVNSLDRILDTLRATDARVDIASAVLMSYSLLTVYGQLEAIGAGRG